MILRRLARSSQVLAPRTTESLIRLSAHRLRAPCAPSVRNSSLNPDSIPVNHFSSDRSEMLLYSRPADSATLADRLSDAPHMPTTERLTLPVAVHMFLICNDQILLLRRFNTGFEDGKFSVPAGHLEGDETITEAAARELLEEIGVRVAPQDLQVVGVMHRRSRSERIDFFVRVKAWADTPINQEPDKCDLLAWFPLSDLPVNTVAYVRHALLQHLQGAWFYEHGWGA